MLAQTKWIHVGPVTKSRVVAITPTTEGMVEIRQTIIASPGRPTIGLMELWLHAKNKRSDIISTRKYRHSGPWANRPHGEASKAFDAVVDDFIDAVRLRRF